MTVTTVYPDSTEGYIVTTAEAAWATVRDATTGNSVFNSNNYVLNSARYSSSLYSVYQGMSKYSVSSITGVVSSVVWNTYVNFVNGTDTYGSKAVAIDWGTTLEVADLVSRSELTSATLLASTSFPSANNTWKQWTSESGMNSYIQNATTAYFLTCSDRQYSNVAPVGDVYWAYASNRTTEDSYLTVTWAPPEVTGTAVGNLGAVTGTAVGQSFTPGVGTGTLGAIIGTALGESITLGTGSSTIGAITGTATGAITRFGTVSTELGALTGTVTGTVTAYGVGTSSLGGLDGTALGTVTVAGTGQGTLGELTATGTGTVTVSGQGSGVLGAVVGTASGEPFKSGIGEAVLGALTGTAVGTSLTIVYGYGGSVLGAIVGQCVAESRVTENVTLIGGGTRGTYVASPDGEATYVASGHAVVVKSAVRSGVA